MHIAVTGMAVGDNGHIVFPCNFLYLFYEPGYLTARDHDISELKRSISLDSMVKRLSCFKKPPFCPLTCRDHYLGRSMLPAQVRDSGKVLCNLLLGITFHNNHKKRRIFMIRYFPLQVTLDDIDNTFLHKFYPRGYYGKHEDFRYGIDGMLKIVERNEKHFALFRPGGKPEHDFRHHSKGPFRPDNKLCQVIAR